MFDLFEPGSFFGFFGPSFLTSFVWAWVQFCIPLFFFSFLGQLQWGEHSIF